MIINYPEVNLIYPPGNTMYAAITAIVSANVVLVAYIIESVREESRLKAKDRQQQNTESKKDQ